MFRIAVLGPESTGKSLLAQALATHYEGEWVSEYARRYVEGLNRKYNYEDICHIAKTQIAEMEQFRDKEHPKFVFFDTELIITKIWFEYCYGKVPSFLTKAMQKKYFDFYLLCYYDLEWIPDPVREHGNDRPYFFERYKHEIEKTACPYIIISGKDEIRIKNAIAAIDQFLKTNTIK